MLKDASEYLFTNPWVMGLPESHHVCRAHWASPRPFNPHAPTGGTAVQVYASHGRWVVSCPDCNSAVLAPATDLRFMCVECANAANGGRFRPVVWPDHRADIEWLLEMRPKTAQNWLPSETLDDLAEQNIERGVGGPDGKTGNRIVVPGSRIVTP